jgi:hypothetical protein
MKIIQAITVPEGGAGGLQQAKVLFIQKYLRAGYKLFNCGLKVACIFM